MKTSIKILLIVLLLHSTVVSIAQLIGPKWEVCFGGTEWDEGTGIIFAGNTYWIVGTTESNDDDISFNHGAWDIWMINTDSLGNFISEKTFGGSNADGGFPNIIKLNDSVFYIGGITKSVDGDIGDNPWPGPGANFWLLKVNNLGDILWESVAGGSYSDEVRDMIIAENDGGVLMMGITTSSDGDVTIKYGSWDIWMVKFNASGIKQWDFTLGSTENDLAGSVKQTSDGGYIVCGSTSGYGGGNYDSTCNHHSLGYFDVWVVKLDSLRNIQWQQCYGGYYHDGGSNIIEVDNGYVVLGSTMSNDGDVSGYHGQPGDTDYEGDIWVFKINKVGNLIWQNCLGGYSGEHARNIFTTTDGGYMIVGTTGSDNGDVEGYHGIDTGIYEDVWFAKLDSLGQLTWQYCYGGGGRELLYRGVLQKSDFNYVLTLGTDTDDWQCGGFAHQWPDLRVVEIGDSLTAINERYIRESKKPFILSPNPASSIITVTLGNQAKATGLKLFNSKGQEVKQITLNDFKRKHEIDIEGLPTGLYVVVLLDGSEMIGMEKVLIKH